MSTSARRRSSVSATQLPSGRRASLGGATPNLATPSTDPSLGGNRRGSLKDLAAQRELLNRVALEQKERRRKPRDELRAFLSNHTVADLRACVEKGKLIEIDGALKPTEGFEILLQNNIEAAPVYTRNAAGVKEYSGFLDIRDLLSSIVYVYTQPLDEDALVYTADGGAEVEFVPSTHGLEGIADLTDVYKHTNAGASDEATTDTTLVTPGVQTSSGTDQTDAKDTHAPEPSLQSATPAMATPTRTPHTDEAGDTIGAIPVISSTSPISRLNVAQADSITSGTTVTGSEPLQSETTSGETSGTDSPNQAPISTAAQWEETIRKGIQKFSSVTSPTNIGSPTMAAASVADETGVTSPGISAVSVDGTGGGRAAFKEANTITLTYLARRNPFKPVTATTPLLELAEHFARGQRRVPVVEPPSDDSSGSDDAKSLEEDSSRSLASLEAMSRWNLVDIISQVAVVEFILAHASSLPTFMAADIEQCDLGTRNVATIQASRATALDAFAQMDEMRLTGIAIVDDHYRMLGATSSRDLKRLAMNKGRLSLDLSLVEYLRKSRKSDTSPTDESAESSETTSKASIMKRLSEATTSRDSTEREDDQAILFQKVGSLCMPIRGSTLGDVARALTRSHTNRVFFLDADQEPVRVTSFTDIMRLAVD